MKKKSLCVLLGVFLVLCLVSGNNVWADKAAEKGKELLKKNQDAVVTVKLVIKISMYGQSRDNTTEATGVIIDDTGLTVSSLTTTDPSSIWGSLMGQSGEMDTSTSITEAKIRLTDGTEIPAEIVLRDKDLDLAFFRPVEKPEKPLVTLDLKDNTTLEVLDEIFIMNRLGKVANWATYIDIERIAAIIDKPRTFYVPQQDKSQGGLGCPVFSMDGKLVGIVTMRILPGQGIDMGMLLGGQGGMGIMPVILPAEDIIEAAKQAPSPKWEEKKEE